MSSNILEEDKTITITLPQKQYTYLAQVAKYLYIQGVAPSPILEDFVHTALAFYINMASKNLGQKTRWDYPKQIPLPAQYQQQYQPQPQQQQGQAVPPGYYQHQHQQLNNVPEVQDEAYTVEYDDGGGEGEQEDNVDLDGMVNNTLRDQLDQEMGLLKRNLGKLSGAGQNVRSSQGYGGNQ